MKRNLLVKHGAIVTHLGAVEADLLIRNGIIADIGRSLSDRDAPVVDATGCLVFPGVVDPHVQLELPALTDDFDSGTKTAACGGVTTIIDFADQPRGVDALKHLKDRRAAADAKVNVDYTLHMSITDLSGDTLNHIRTIVKDEKVASFKLYLAYSRRQRMVNDGEAFAVMREAAKHGAVVGVHAESDSLCEYLTTELIQSGRSSPSCFPQSRPEVAEAISVSAAIGLARATKCDLYVHHVSTALAIDLIARAKREGQRVWAETCPHYLLLTDEVYAQEDGCLYIMNPPLRASENVERLWKALQRGEVDTIGTDHCSYMAEQKRKSPRFDQVVPGVPGIETLLPVMYTEGVAKGRISLGRLVELLCLNPARIFGLFPYKGNLSVGSDGDLVIFNPRFEWTLKAADLHTHADFCPFEGYRVAGRVEKTVLRGEIIFDGKTFCGTPQAGGFVPGSRGG